MQTREILHILEDWNLWNHDLESGLSRTNYLVPLQNMLKSGQVITITGARRSGKSYLMRQCAKALTRELHIPARQILMVNFEDPRFEKMEIQLLDRIFKVYCESFEQTGQPFLFLDEIQQINGWEKWVRVMHELRKAHIIVSGSNAKLLSREFASTLTGRHLDQKVLPFSFSEFLAWRQVDVFKAEPELIYACLNEYLMFGGFPEVVRNLNKKEILLAYVNDVVERDLMRRYKVRKGEQLRGLLRWYLSNIAAPITFTRLGKWLSLTPDTVEKFSTYFTDAYLIFFLKRFSYKIKEQEKSPRKIYAVDTGLSHAAGFEFSENLGHHFENVVFLELSRKCELNPDLKIWYWKDVQHREVDFVIQDGVKVVRLVQVVWDIKNPDTKKRELRSLMIASNQFPEAELLVITSEYEGEEILQNKHIRYVPLWKWLTAI